MFDRKTYLNYFEIIKEKEETMILTLNDALSFTENPRTRDVLESILKDEYVHKKLVDEVIGQL